MKMGQKDNFMERNNLYPIFLKTKNLHVLIIGGGFVAEEKLTFLLKSSPDANVVGYRDGENWYDENGLPVNSPTELGTIIVPALQGFSSAQTDPQGEEYDPRNSFEDYTPNLIVMPRISFSFPIGEKANFYANYDILAMRPPEGAYASALTYYNFRNNAANSVISNPTLSNQCFCGYVVVVSFVPTRPLL